MNSKQRRKKGNDEIALGDVFGIDPDQPNVDKFFNLKEEEEDIPVTDTEGRVVGVIDFSKNWIRSYY